MKFGQHGWSMQFFCKSLKKKKKWQGFSREYRRAGGQPHPAKAMSVGCGLRQDSLKAPATPFDSGINQCCFHLTIRPFIGVTRCKYKSDSSLLVILSYSLVAEQTKKASISWGEPHAKRNPCVLESHQNIKPCHISVGLHCLNNLSGLPSVI